MKSFLLILSINVLLFGCKPCDSGGYNNVYNFYSRSGESLLDYYKSLQPSMFYTGHDTIIVQVDSSVTVKNTTPYSSKSNAYSLSSNCEDYYYYMNSQIYASDTSGSLFITLSGTGEIRIKYSNKLTSKFNFYTAFLDANSSTVDTIINGTKYSDVIKSKVANSKSSVGFLLYNHEFGILGLKSDSLEFLRVP